VGIITSDMRAIVDSAHLCFAATVTPDGRPQSSPVWFVWDSEAVLVASEPSSGKVRPANCASIIPSISAKGTSIGIAMLTTAGVGGTMEIFSGNGQSGVV